MPSTLRVLLVDDNPQDRLLVVRELRKEYPGIQTVEPRTQEQFVAALEDEPFDIVVTDYQLRWTTGLEVLRAVKQRWPRCPVVMFTATGSEEIAVEAMKEGLDDYVIKSVVHLVRLRASVRAVLERSATARQVEQLETRLAALLGSLKLGVYRRSASGELLECNDAFRRILGLEPHEPLQGRRLADFVLDPAQCSVIEARCQQPCARGEFEIQLRRVDGQPIWAALNESQPDSTSDPDIIEGLLEDISARKQTEQALRQTEASLAHISRVTTMGELLAGIAHEVNQPLSAIANYAVACLKQLEKISEPRLGEVEKWVRGISEQAGRAAGILSGIRQFVRREEATRAKHDLNELLEEALNLLAFEIQHWHVQLQKDLFHPSPRVEVDRLQIQQVVVNLVRNAIEAMQANDPASRRLVVATRLEPQWAVVEVHDTGTGIENPDQLFKPFVTTKPKGMGMGLAVSQTIIRSHGGRIWATPNPQGGAVFCFTIPRARSSVRDATTDGIHRG